MTPKYNIVASENYQLVAQISEFDVFVRRPDRSADVVYEAGVEWGPSSFHFSDTVSGVLHGIRRGRSRTGQRVIDQIAAVLTLMGVPE